MVALQSRQQAWRCAGAGAGERHIMAMPASQAGIPGKMATAAAGM